LGQSVGIELGAAEVGIERVGRILELRLRALQHLEQRCQLGVVGRHPGQQVDRPRGERVGADVAVRHGVEGTARGVDQRLAVRQALVLGVQFVPFIGTGRELVQLADLPSEPLALALQLALLGARAGQRFAGCLPARPQAGQRGRLGAGLRVQQRSYRGRPGEALPGMLTMDVDQVVGRLVQLRNRGGAAVDPGAAAALGIDRAAQKQRAVGLEARLVEPAGQRCGRVELGADLGSRGAFAHDAGVAAAAERQLQRIDEDGLACAGFAGEHREACIEIELERGHDDEVAQ
jgi:hypothetical protein